jgi:hypothetical protein
MRIVAGKFRGKQLISPEDDSIRPTADRVRESVFNILANRLGPNLDGLHVLDHRGEPLFVLALPVSRGGTWSGGLAAPTLDDIDGDGELELVVNTSGAGVLAYDLPGTRHARPLWATGRGSYLRAGFAFNDRIFIDGCDG